MYVFIIHHVGSKGLMPGVATYTETSTVFQTIIDEMFKESTTLQRALGEKPPYLGVGLSIDYVPEGMYVEINNTAPLTCRPKNQVYELKLGKEGWVEGWKNEEGEFILQRIDDVRHLKHLPKDHA